MSELVRQILTHMRQERLIAKQTLDRLMAARMEDDAGRDPLLDAYAASFEHRIAEAQRVLDAFDELGREGGAGIGGRKS